MIPEPSQMVSKWFVSLMMAYAQVYAKNSSHFTTSGILPNVTIWSLEKHGSSTEDAQISADRPKPCPSLAMDAMGHAAPNHLPIGRITLRPWHGRSLQATKLEPVHLNLGCRCFIENCHHRLHKTSTYGDSSMYLRVALDLHLVAITCHSVQMRVPPSSQMSSSFSASCWRSDFFSGLGVPWAPWAALSSWSGIVTSWVSEQLN